MDKRWRPGMATALVGLMALSAVPFACGSSDGKRRSQGGAGGASGTGGTSGAVDDGRGGDAGAAVGGAPAAAAGAGGHEPGASGEVGGGGSDGANASGGAAGGAGGGPGVEPEVIGAYVDCEAGDDAGNGTLGEPLKTLALAATRAPAGTTIVVLDGLCDETTQAPFSTANGKITLPDGVSLRAETPGGVTFHGVNGSRSAGIALAGSGKVSGIHFERFGIAISASSGQVELSELTFNDVRDGHPFNLSGTVEATLTPGSVANSIGTNQSHFAWLSDSAKLTVLGGRIQGAVDSQISGASLFTAADDSVLVLDGVTLQDNDIYGVVATGNAKLTIKNGSLFRTTAPNTCCKHGHVGLGGMAQLELLDSDIEGSPSSAIDLGAGTPQITIRRSKLSGSREGAIKSAIGSNSYPTIVLEDVELRDNVRGIYSNYGATVEITNSVITDNGLLGCEGSLYLNPTQVNHVKLRGTTVIGHCGLGLVGAAGSSFDLGRGNDPGLNVLTGNPVNKGYARVSIDVAAGIVVYAAGNTWLAGEQGSGAAGSSQPLPGQYAVATGHVRDVTGPVSTGANYQIASGLIRLAEDPCVVNDSCP